SLSHRAPETVLAHDLQSAGPPRRCPAPPRAAPGTPATAPPIPCHRFLWPGPRLASRDRAPCPVAHGRPAYRPRYSASGLLRLAAPPPSSLRAPSPPCLR